MWENSRLSRDNLVFRKGELTEVCRRGHVVKLSLFGSVLGEDVQPDSDVDVLLVFEEGHVLGVFRLAWMKEEPSDLLGRGKVGLRTLQDLSRYFRDEVLASLPEQYTST